MRGAASIGVLGLAACTATNPAYEAGGGEDSSDATSSSVDTMVESGPADEGSSSGAAPGCELHPDRELDIRVMGPDFMATCTEAGMIRWLGQGNIQYPGDGGRIEHSRCDPSTETCPCMSGPIGTVIELGGGLLWPPDALDLALPSCGDVGLWSRPTSAGECEWAGVVVLHQAEGKPDFIAARTLEVPPLEETDYAIAIDLEADGPCTTEESCSMRDPGPYALDVYGELVQVGAIPDFYTVPYGDGELYLFENRMASITDQCEQKLAWTAQRSW